MIQSNLALAVFPCVQYNALLSTSHSGSDQYRASRELARVGFLYLRFLTIQLQQAHPPTVDAHELHRVALTRHLNEILRGVAF